MYQHVYYVLCFCKIYKWVCNNAWFEFDLGFVKMMNVNCCKTQWHFWKWWLWKGNVFYIALNWEGLLWESVTLYLPIPLALVMYPWVWVVTFRNNHTPQNDKWVLLTKCFSMVENDVMKVWYIYCFKLWRLTLGIGNFMSSHSLSAGHVPLGLGRDKVGIRALAQFMHFQC